MISSILVLDQGLMANKPLAVSSICLNTLNHYSRTTKFYQCITSIHITASWKHTKFLSLDNLGHSMINTIYPSGSQPC